MIHPITYIDPESISLDDYIKESLFNVDMQIFKSDSLFYNKIGNYTFAKTGLRNSTKSDQVDSIFINSSWKSITAQNKSCLLMIEAVLTTEFMKMFKRLSPKKQLKARFRGKRLIKLSNGK